MNKLLEMIESQKAGEKVPINSGMSSALFESELTEIKQPTEGYILTHRLRVGNQSALFDNGDFNKVDKMAKRSICRLVYADIHEHLELLYQAVGTGDIFEVRKVLEQVELCYKGV